ncbi:MAG: UrcA family protein [Caulobacteraceae bacterium]
MTRKSSVRATLAFLALSTLALAAAPAVAQSYDDDEIVVVAPGVVREPTGRRTSSGIPITDLVTQRLVTAKDLDLRYDADVNELHRRIRVTAEDACNDIERASAGMLITSDRECVRDAMRDAMAQADALVYSARG